MGNRRLAILLFLLVFTVCAMTAGGHFYSSDTWETFLWTESIVEYHTLQIIKPSFEGFLSEVDPHIADNTIYREGPSVFSREQVGKKCLPTLVSQKDGVC